jgi:hypothetical protein
MVIALMDIESYTNNLWPNSTDNFVFERAVSNDRLTKCPCPSLSHIYYCKSIPTGAGWSVEAPVFYDAREYSVE